MAACGKVGFAKRLPLCEEHRRLAEDLWERCLPPCGQHAVASPHGWHAICEPSQRQSAAAALCVPRTDGRGGRARRVLGEGSRGARVKLARIDGARGMGGRIEYNVPRDPRGGMQLVNYGFALNDLLAGEELTAPVQALRCDGHQHMGAPAALN